MNAIIPGALHFGDESCTFTVWAPYARQVSVRLLPPRGRTLPLIPGPRGYHSATVSDVPAGTRYLYVLDGREHPDPASRYQPEGVNGPSEICNRGFRWTDGEWRGLGLQGYVIYELHVGVFTPEGSLDAIVPRLKQLRDLGITAVELMPVAQFPGERNWGYDGSYPYAVQNSYGGPQALKRFVDACHEAGLAAVLDVVYNHFGPEGNHAGEFGPYFTDRYRTPWGPAINFDGQGSDEVRRFFIENALYWLREFHFDALRLDALHAILDTSASPFLAELSAEVTKLRRQVDRKLYLIGESDLNDPRLIRERERGGLGLHAQWSDDFHHALHVLLTGEPDGYYADFGSVKDLAAAWCEGYTYSGQYSAYRQRKHGAPAADVPPWRFVVCAQNHDQVGNRAAGDRLSSIVSFDRLKVAAACVLLSAHVPLLFMGEEYGETAPFQYFVHHSDQALIEAVRNGRRSEFEAFRWRGEIPDPQDAGTFINSRLHWEWREQGRHKVLITWYAELLRLRTEEPLFTAIEAVAEQVQVFESHRILLLRRSAEGRGILLACNFADTAREVEVDLPAGWWLRLADSSSAAWGGPGSTVPEKLNGTGKAKLRLQPNSLVVLSMQEGRK
ncbi:MAG: malto-oligosyltrehalose trehalohydrolase [Dehalococcoidia bacterium]|nr:malto-oligosyltrehalose trehalohydrolase [Dehalococcoidia bacterium]